jgi:hypothetical protein
VSVAQIAAINQDVGIKCDHAALHGQVRARQERVLVILDSKRHLILFNDGDGGADLTVEPFHGCFPRSQAIDQFVAAAEQAHDAQAGGSRLFRDADSVFEDRRVFARQEGWISRYMPSSSFMRRVFLAQSKSMAVIPPCAPAAPTFAASSMSRSAAKMFWGELKRIDWKESDVKPMLVRRAVAAGRNGAAARPSRVRRVM